MQNDKSPRAFPATESELVRRLEEMLPSLLEGLVIKRIRRRPRGIYTPDLEVDVQVGRVSKRLIIEVKRIGERGMVMAGVHQLMACANRVKDAYPVLMSTYLTDSSRRFCKEWGVGYADLTGNVYLHFNGIFIDRTGVGALRLERKSVRGLSMPATSRVIRRLLGNPKRRFGMTELAAASSVSPAQAYKVSNLLEQKGFARRDSERRVVLERPGDLLEAWASSLDFRRNWIIPAFSLRRTPEAIMRSIAEFSTRRNRMYALTMFAGASLVAPFVRFYDVTCYIQGEPEPWLKGLDMKEVESGSNIQLVVPLDTGVFQDVQRIDRLNVVSNLQLFADLYGNPARGREQAAFLRERRIGF